MRPWAHHAHIAFQDVDELWELIDAQLPEPAACRVNSIVVRRSLLRHVGVVNIHRAILPNLEPLVLQTVSFLNIENGSRRLQPLKQPNNESEHRQNENHYGQ